MNDFRTNELTRTETQLYRVQHELVVWERNGSTAQTEIAHAFVQSLRYQIKELQSDLAAGHC